jgi:hypothetical protein
MQRLICHLEWVDTSEDPSRFSTIECANCGASVSPDVEVIDLNVPECKRLMRDFIRSNPQIWNEDIGRSLSLDARAVLLMVLFTRVGVVSRFE